MEDKKLDENGVLSTLAEELVDKVPEGQIKEESFADRVKRAKFVVGQKKPSGRNSGRVPSSAELEYYANQLARKENFIERDPVLNSLKNYEDPQKVLHNILTAIAEETSSIHFQRIELEKLGLDSTGASIKRIEALKKAADLQKDIVKVIAEKAMSSEDLRSETFQKLMMFWTQVVNDVVIKTLDTNAAEAFFQMLALEMDGWEEKAADFLKKP